MYNATGPDKESTKYRVQVFIDTRIITHIYSHNILLVAFTSHSQACSKWKISFTFNIG